MMGLAMDQIHPTTLSLPNSSNKYSVALVSSTQTCNPHSPEGQEIKIKASADLLSSESPLPDLQTGLFIYAQGKG